VKTAFSLAEEFLAPRGLKINREKSLVKKLPNDSFTFVGFEFRTSIQHGKSKVLVIPPKEKVRGVLRKVSAQLKFSRSFEKSLLKVNPILRGWCNFYSSGNSSNHFKNLNWHLWHTMYHFLMRKYRFLPAFRKKNQSILRKKLSTYVWEKHLRKYQWISRWWCVTEKDRELKNKRYKGNLYLFAPALQKVVTSGILVKRPDNSDNSISAFNPDERILLNAKAVSWRRGLTARLLRKQKGLCALCKCSLVDGEVSFDDHHAQPVELGGKYKLSNLRVLCLPCHSEVTTAVKTRNLPLVEQYEALKILEGVSDAIRTGTLASQKSPEQRPGTP
jgi:hypothetical protein